MKFKSSVLSYPYITDGGAGVGVVYSFVRDRIHYQRMYYIHAIYFIGVYSKMLRQILIYFTGSCPAFLDSRSCVRSKIDRICITAWPTVC
jgi:hypothetical protein